MKVLIGIAMIAACLGWFATGSMAAEVQANVSSSPPLEQALAELLSEVEGT